MIAFHAYQIREFTKTGKRREVTSLTVSLVKGQKIDLTKKETQVFLKLWLG